MDDTFVGGAGRHNERDKVFGAEHWEAQDLLGAVSQIRSADHAQINKRPFAAHMTESGLNIRTLPGIGKDIILIKQFQCRISLILKKKKREREREKIIK